MRDKKNLAIFIHSLGKGGAERVVSVLLNALKDSFNISLVLLEKEIVYDIPKNINIKILKTNSKSFLAKLISIPILAFKYKKFCKNYNIDMSLSLLSRSNFISVLSKIFLNKTNIIISEHTNLSLWRREEKVYFYFLKAFVFITYNIADGIIVVSKHIKRDLIRNYKILNTKISVIYNPYEIDKIIELSKEKIEYIKNEKGLNFISIGTLLERKGFYLLLEAFSLLSNKNHKLFILGDGKERANLEKFAKDLKIEDRVYFLGFVSNPYKYLRSSDVFVLASYKEGLPNVIIEALACGCAVISSDCISGPREILAPDTDFKKTLKEGLEYAKFGILTSVGDKKSLYDAMSNIDVNLYKKNSNLRAKDFAYEKSSELYKSVLLEV